MNKRYLLQLAFAGLGMMLPFFASGQGGDTGGHAVENPLDELLIGNEQPATPEHIDQEDSSARPTPEQSADEHIKGDQAALDVIPIPTKVEAPAQSSSQPEPRAHLEEIVVTATKREQSVRDIPASVSAMRGEDLEKSGAHNIKDYLMQVPGISLDEGESGESGGRRLTIRGVGPAQSTGNATVGQFLGDVPVTDPYFSFTTPDLDPFDLKTVEVLKGPQGTTFGGTALNGAIRYVPNAPQLETWSVRGFADRTAVSQGSAANTYGAEFNVPLGQTFAFRAAGVLQNVPGVYDNLQTKVRDADGRRKWSGRGIIRWEPIDSLSVNAMYLKQNSHTDDVLVADNNNGELSNNSKPSQSSIDSDFRLANIDLRYDLDSLGSLVLQSARQNKSALLDYDGGISAAGSLGVETLRAHNAIDITADTHELRLVSPSGGDWNWIVGVFLMNYTAEIDAYTYVPLDALGVANPGPLLSTLPGLSSVFFPLGINVSAIHMHPLVAKERSFYGELSRHFGEDWELTLGLRHYDTRLKARANNDGANYLTDTAVKNINQSEQGYSPRIALTWKPLDGVMLYAAVARGFQFGGFNLFQASPIAVPNPITGGQVPLQYGSSSLWSRELGLRTDWLDSTLRLDTTIYDLDWKNAQLNQSLKSLVISPAYIDNVGKVKSQGVESTITWLTPLTGFSVNISAAYSRARTAADYDDPGGNAIPSGTAVAASPQWQTSTTLAYGTSLGPWVGTGSVTHSLWSKAFSNLQHDFEIYGFSTLNLNFDVARPDLSWSPTVSLGLNNVLDERGVIGRNGTAGATGSALGQTTTYIRPRTLSLRLSAGF